MRPAGAASHLGLFDGGPRHGPPYPPTPQRSEHPGEAVALLDTPTGSEPELFLNSHTVVERGHGGRRVDGVRVTVRRDKPARCSECKSRTVKV